MKILAVCSLLLRGSKIDGVLIGLGLAGYRPNPPVAQPCKDPKLRTVFVFSKGL